jgi:hypothetical protein
MDMEFYEWITKKYIDWRGDAIGQEKSITKFADMLGVPQSLMTQWLKKGGKIPTSQKYIALLVTHYGVEAYDALNIPRPSEEDVLSGLPSELAKPIISALAEVRSLGLNNEKAKASSEDFDKIKEIFSKHGVNFKITVD